MWVNNRFSCQHGNILPIISQHGGGKNQLRSTKKKKETQKKRWVTSSGSSSSSTHHSPMDTCYSALFRGPELCGPKTLISLSKPSKLPAIVSLPCRSWPRRRTPRTVCSVSVSKPELRTGRPDDLVASILSKVARTDGGVLLSKEQHREVDNVAKELQKYCVAEPVKCPLIFGEWDVVYCSRPTSPGGGYRSALGRLVFRTKEMVQAVEAPDTVRNLVSFSAFGFLDGEVSLKGKLKSLDDSWIQVIFEPPQLKVGPLEFQYGGESEVQLQITYIDEKIRLGKGSKGSLFVFQRR